MATGQADTARGESGIPVRSIAAGAALGAVVLGLLGRLATAALALGLGEPAHLGLRSVAESVIVGAALGAVGGGLLPVVRALGATPGLRSGTVVGVALFAATIAAAVALGRVPGFGDAASLPVLAVVLAAFVLYGALLDRAAGATPDGD